MIQDTGLGQEMFIAAYNKNENGVCKTLCYRYTDDLVDIDHHHENDIPTDYLSERSIVYCVSPPGETIWSKSYMADLSDHLSNVTIQPKTLSKQNKKFPLPDVDHIGMIVKMYDNMDTIRVGQLVDVIGILGNTMTTVTTEHHDQQDIINDFDSNLSQYNGTMVLHAITYSPVDNSSPFTHQQINDTLQQARDIRDPLINYIAGSFGGDKLVGEFVLLQLLSKVSNQHHGMKLGQFSLNITKIPDTTTTTTTTTKETNDKNNITTNPLELKNPITKSIDDMLSNLVSHQVSLPLTIDHLNKLQYIPKSVNENLTSGILQLVAGTRILIDETGLSEGQLVDSGVRNMQAIMNIIQNQTLSYAFPYSQFDFDTDLGIITLSSRKSLLPNHCTIPLEPIFPLDQNQFENRALPSKQELDAFRIYLQGARNANYEIPDPISQFIQNEFVNERKRASEQSLPLPSHDDLMLRMNLCRLVSLSFGETQLTKETYEYVVHLDHLRKSRINP
ncbi:unnamed protein product [Cunninghamella echinulata]